MQRLDTVHTFETPEGVDVGLRVAGLLPRALAWAIDAALRYAVLFALSIVLLPLTGLGVGAFLIMLFMMEWFYPVLFEVTRGATPGKKAMGLSVVHDNGTPIGWPSSMIRNLLRVIDFFPLLYAAAIITMLINRQSKRLGDLAAGSLVVYAERVTPHTKAAEAPPLPLPVALSVDDQRALVDFAERSARLAPARVEELAQMLVDAPGPVAVETVLGYASGLARGR